MYVNLRHEVVTQESEKVSHALSCSQSLNADLKATFSKGNWKDSFSENYFLATAQGFH